MDAHCDWSMRNETPDSFLVDSESAVQTPSLHEEIMTTRRDFVQGVWPNFELLSSTAAAAGDMWATHLRCRHVHSDVVRLRSGSAEWRWALLRSRTLAMTGRWSPTPQFRQHAGENLEPEVFFVAQTVGAPLDHADPVVEPLDQAKRDLVLGPAVGGNPIPMPVDHRGKHLIGLETLPLQACTPVLEEAPRPALALIAPKLAKALLEHIGCVEPLVGRQ